VLTVEFPKLIDELTVIELETTEFAVNVPDIEAFPTDVFESTVTAYVDIAYASSLVLLRQ
jgi:hypothetical protein